MIERAKRGHIYQWSKSSRPVLVVSNSEREFDKLIGILVLGASDVGRDVISLQNEELGDNRHVHCFLVTYVEREALIREIGKIPDRKMELITDMMARGLGFDNDAEIKRLEDERDFYHERYNELFEKVIATGGSV